MTRGAEQLSWSADCKILRGRDPVELVRSPSSGLCRSSTSWRWCGSFTVRGPFLISVRIGGRPNHHVMVRRSTHSTSHRNTHSNTHRRRNSAVSSGEDPVPLTGLLTATLTATLTDPGHSPVSGRARPGGGALVGREVAGWVRGRARCRRGRGVVQGWGRAR